MKKIFAVLLVFAMVFVCAACKNKPVDGEVTEPTGRPGAYVTDANGDVQTSAVPYIVLDEKSEPRTEIVTDKEGNSEIAPLTSVAYEPVTYPAPDGQTLPVQATVPVGNTIKSSNEAWPTFAFMKKVPKALDKVDRVDHSEKEEGSVAVIWINSMSYADFLKYIAACEGAGFKPYTAAMPEKPTSDRTTYIFGSIANGLYLHVTYNTKNSPNRFCDVLITVADYDVNSTINEVGTGK